MDPKTLAETLGLGEEEIVELVELFLDTCETDLSKLQTALDADAPRGVAEAAHSIKGASGNMRFESIYELAKSIEMDAREKDLARVRDLAGRMREELARIGERMKDYRL
jgi:histidine phosphotransfer protein HptB